MADDIATQIAAQVKPWSRDMIGAQSIPVQMPDGTTRRVWPAYHRDGTPKVGHPIEYRNLGRQT